MKTKIALILIILSGCSVSQDTGPTITQRQLEQCELDLQVCRNK